jgi:hypothetical protein
MEAGNSRGIPSVCRPVWGNLAKSRFATRMSAWDQKRTFRYRGRRLIRGSRERRQFRDVARIVLDDDGRFQILGDLLEAVE